MEESKEIVDNAALIGRAVAGGFELEQRGSSRVRCSSLSA
jgi:hypothetical protein